MGKQQRMLGIDTLFSNFDRSYFVQDSFLSHTSFFDYDAVIFNTQNIIKHYTTDNNDIYKNKMYLSQSNTIKITEDYRRIKQQIIDYLQRGKNIYLLMGHNENCYIRIKKSNDYRRSFEVPAIFDMYSFLPVVIEETYSYGQEMDFCCNSPYKEFFEHISSFTKYAVYYSTQEEELPLAIIKDSEKTVSSVIEFEGGKIICLPQPNFITRNSAQDYWKDYTIPFLDSLFELNARLQAPEAVVMPEWAENILILDEANHIAAKNQIINDIAESERKLNEEEEILHHIQNYKKLIFTQGTALEEIIKQVFSELGFVLFDTEPGKADIIAKYNDVDIVVEIKGLNKSASQQNDAQLEKWVAEFVIKNEHPPKAILIVNGYCETPLPERTEPVFPDQMIPLSTAWNHALLSTTQLLCLYIEIKNNPSVKEDRIKELLETVGVYQRYDDISQYIKCVNETGETND